MRNEPTPDHEELKSEETGIHDLGAFRKQRFDSYRFKPTTSPEEFRHKAEAYEDAGRLGDLEHELMEGEGRLLQLWKAEEDEKRRVREEQKQEQERKDAATAERLKAEIQADPAAYAGPQEPTVAFPQRMIPTQIIKRPEPGLADKIRRFFGRGGA